MVKLSDIKSALHPDVASQKDGVFTVRWGFFYPHGKTSQDFVNRVLAVYPGATIIDHDMVWKPFNGGASVSNQSHWYVKFTVKDDLRNALCEVAQLHAMY